MQPEKIQKHLGSKNCVAAGVVTCFDKNLSEEDVVNLHIEAMQKIASIEPKDYRLLDKGILAQINMDRIVGYNEN